jgi:2,4-dienoyl-CoA reductase-like NADH-dependent reductase (Old Yellow Enzyme family)
MHKIFTPAKLGAIDITNRIIMAPLTRARAGVNRTPNQLMLEYYAQRASAGLILTEATSISPMGVGYADTPGIWNEAQIEGWSQITQAVHARGGKIVLQLWHVGRISDPVFLKGKLPVAPSAIRPLGRVSLVRPEKAFEIPRALELQEIKEVVQDYKKAAFNAKRAGFDGVEIHSANGYLIEQFLSDHANQRRDEYGGSLENRMRFLLEIVEAIGEVWESGRIGVHLSPRGDAHDARDSKCENLYVRVAEELNKKRVGFICTREYQGADELSVKMREAFQGDFIRNEKFTFESAQKAIDRGECTAVAFGVPFIANPDLVERFQRGAPLNPANPASFYGPDARGYTDYPFMRG